MRLTYIKLAGFKSFVDPTTIPISTSLTGIVGPNGCGKSNVIDAVRWVMGESSAKHLRGGTMADVIFNGTSARKPVGQASIELVFDNSDGTLGGQYASYSEISVKRVVGRDGLSQYLLNGTRCRRRDITDVFLGTGLGPRSYSIIEQGMISRLIEAKPEELRMFLEEAAGISKYRERRRETENRIRHSRDNIDRLNDLTMELEKQLGHLQRQTKMAEKYKKLKQEERLLKAQLLALRWRAIDNQAGEINKIIQQTETAYEAQVAVVRNIEAATEKQRAQHTEATEKFNHVQGDVYSVAADIARVEQTIQHTKEKHQQMEQDLEQIEAAIKDGHRDLSTDNNRTDELQLSLKELEPALASIRETEEASSKQYERAEETMQDWQFDWEDFNARAAENARVLEVERTRIQHIEAQQKELQSRINRYQEQSDGLSPDKLETSLGTLGEQLKTISTELDRLNTDLETYHDRIADQRRENSEKLADMDEQRSQLQGLQGRLASLEALQEAALGKQEGVVTQWLDKHGLKGAQRLAENIKVTKGWERAVETVLGFNLESVCIDDLKDLAGVIGSLQKGALSALDKQKPGKKANHSRDGELLSSKIESDWQLDSVSGDVYTADSLASAFSMRSQLLPHESVVTRDGVWIGSNWMRVARGLDEKAGVLSREQEIEDIRQQIEQQQKQIDSSQRQLEQGEEKLQSIEDERDKTQQQVLETGQRKATLQAEVNAGKASLGQIHNQHETIKSDVSDLTIRIQQNEADLLKAKAKLEIAESVKRDLEKERETLIEKRDAVRTRLDEARDQANDDQEQAHQMALRVETMRTALESTQQAMERLHNQLHQFEKRQDDLRKSLQDSDMPIVGLTAELEQLLEKRLKFEAALNEAREKMEAIEQQVRQSSRERNEAEEAVQEKRSMLEKARLDYQGIDVRRQTVQEQIDESDYTLGDLFKELPDEADEEEWHIRVEKIDKRIQRLGAINLAAIDEFNELSERKQYLDAQLVDLHEALATLENAIHKIDRETRTRFKDTFDKVDSGLQKIYPRLFGGGTANLEMDSDDLLTTGVTVMARPPGKRLTSIHLMSGGEKALTAVAMVFAIFELNPAPFCLLDEVDAPLDDANVGRFCELLKEMSDRIQFIFITHNKLTMEIAHHLTGVTMQEAGVSRIVAVDVDEAAKLAAV